MTVSRFRFATLREYYEACRRLLAGRAERVASRPKARRPQPRTILSVERLGERLLPSASPLPFVEGVSSSAQVAAFTDSDGNTNPSQYSAQINLGNGQTVPSSMIAYSNGQFQVYGNMQYAEEGVIPSASAFSTWTATRSTPRT